MGNLINSVNVPSVTNVTNVSRAKQTAKAIKRERDNNAKNAANIARGNRAKLEAKNKAAALKLLQERARPLKKSPTVTGDTIANINTILGRINSLGVANTNRFSLVITGIGSKVTFLNSDKGQDFAIQCESVGMPGRSFSTREHKMHGAYNKKPYESAYEDVTAIFRLSPGLEERAKFSEWMNVIQNPDTGNFSYLEEYSSVIDIRHYDNRASTLNSHTYGIKLIDAYPINMAEIDYNMATQNEYAKIAITFTYRKWLEI